VTKAYTLDEFLARFDEWADWETPRPPDDMRYAVLSWLLTRGDNPYEGVKRAEGFDNLWYGMVPGTEHGDGKVVVCSYWIIEAERRVRCESFAVLGLPI
jgi:hypothetical protein